MKGYEQQYYESEKFWDGDMLQDAENVGRYKLTASLVPTDAKSLLDAGCGNGVFVNILSRERPDLSLCALDRSKNALSHVQAAHKRQGDVVALPFDDRSFDCVSCLQVIEHLPVDAFQQALNELTRVAEKYVIVSVPYQEVLEDSYNRCPQCRTIFNFELHLRSFTEPLFRDLLRSQGFENIALEKTGLSRTLKYRRAFLKFFYPEQALRWNSPICPVCGYTSPKTEQTAHDNETKPMQTAKHRSLISYITPIPKLFWPREDRYYWILGLFERTTK